MSRWELRDLFAHNKSSDTIGAALALLLRADKVRRIVKPATGRGRPTEMWTAI